MTAVRVRKIEDHPGIPIRFEKVDELHKHTGQGFALRQYFFQQAYYWNLEGERETWRQQMDPMTPYRIPVTDSVYLDSAGGACFWNSRPPTEYRLTMQEFGATLEEIINLRHGEALEMNK